tara:strand:- start:128 stop:406 length:279 start_codon:yes stop_codon:yes gene_type:complete
MDYKITLTDTEDKALAYAAASQQDWIDNVIHNRCRIAIDDIVKIAVDKFLEAGESMPGDKDQIVAIAFERGWVKTAAQRNLEAQAIMEKQQQ